jgi:hypothetical protein
VIHVLRKPLSEGTVASNVVKHRTGGLNIDASRISGIDPANAKRIGRNYTTPDTYFVSKVGQKTHAVVGGSLKGRWPANLILQHLAECRSVGTRRVKAAGWRDTDAHKGDQGVAQNFGASDITGTHYADAEGKETVANWICAPGCAVPALDEQSGSTKSTGGRIGNAQGVYAGLGVTGFGTGHEKGDPGFGDEGGASRYFKQIGGEE